MLVSGQSTLNVADGLSDFRLPGGTQFCADKVLEANTLLFRQFDTLQSNNALHLSNELPKHPYIKIAQEWGHTDPEIFLKRHKHLEGSGIYSDASKLKATEGIGAISADRVAEFLESSAHKIFEHYLNNARVHGLGMCIPYSDLALKTINSFQECAYRSAVRFHWFTAVNIEGLAYILDFTFSQFTDKAITPEMEEFYKFKEQGAGIVLMPLTYFPAVEEKTQHKELEVRDFIP